MKPTAGTALLWYNHLSDGRGKNRKLQLHHLHITEFLYFVYLGHFIVGSNEQKSHCHMLCPGRPRHTGVIFLILISLWITFNFSILILNVLNHIVSYWLLDGLRAFLETKLYKCSV